MGDFDGPVFYDHDLLLSSKLVLVLILLYLLFFVGRFFYVGRKRWILPVFISLIALLIALIALTENPVKKRFADITTGSGDLFRQETFSPEIYFNGVQFRLLTWRFTGEILDQKDAWLAGVSAGNAQHELNRRYTETRMFLGDGSGSGGFRGFDCHNVYLQTLLESGIVGLILFLIACGFLLAQAIRRSNTQALVFFLALLIFGFSESVLSTQYALQIPDKIMVHDFYFHKQVASIKMGRFLHRLQLKRTIRFYRRWLSPIRKRY